MASPKIEGVELWPVVDGKDKIIGHTSEAVFTAIPSLRPRLSFVIAHNDEGFFLLQQRSLAKSRFPGFWTVSASGHVRANESYRDAARREFIEELNIEPETPLDQIARLRIDLPSNPSFSSLFETVCNDLGYPNPEEVEKTAFYSMREIEKIVDKITAPSQILLRAAGLL